LEIFVYWSFHTSLRDKESMIVNGKEKFRVDEKKAKKRNPSKKMKDRVSSQ